MQLRSWLVALALAATGGLALLALSTLRLSWEQPSAEAPAGLAHASVPGRILFGHAGDIWVAEGGGLRAVTQGGRYWGQPDWSPDGGRIALVGWGQSATDIFVLNEDGSGLRQLTTNQARRPQDSRWALQPRWSPQGDVIAFLSDRASFYPTLWLMNGNGTGARQVVPARTTSDAVDSFAWSPDGTRVAATRFTAATSQIDLIDVGQRGAARAITSEPEGAFDPTWSPDGRYIAYAAREGKRVRIKVMEPDGNGQPYTLVYTELGRFPRWSPFGSALAYIQLAGAEFELFVVDVSEDSEGQLGAGRPTQLTRQFGVDATSGLSWAP